MMASSSAMFVDGSFPLSKLACLNASINANGWLSLSLQKDISDTSVRYVYFSGKQMKELIQLIPKMDKILQRTSADSRQCIDIGIKSGEKRLIAYTFNKKLFVEVATFSRIKVDNGAPAWKKSKGDDDESSLTKVKNQCITLTIQEWCTLKDKLPAVVQCIASLEMEINGTSGNGVSDEMRYLTVYTWSSANDDGEEEEEGEHFYYIQKQCMKEGAKFQKEKKRRDRVMVRTEEWGIPSIDHIMRAAYVWKARSMMQKSKKRTCSACQNGSYVDEAAPEHLLGCKSPWEDAAEMMYRKIRGEIDLDQLKKLVMCFLAEVGLRQHVPALMHYQLVYDNDLVGHIFTAFDNFDVSVASALTYIRDVKKNDDEEDMVFSDDEDELAPMGLCMEMSQAHHHGPPQ
jgi:hypothetical protein